MTTYRKRDETAQIIWDDLDQNGDSTSWEIRRRTGLTHMQFAYGLGYLKDELQTDNGQPLVWSPYRGVYSLTDDEAEWEEYVLRYRMRSLDTQVGRLLQTAEAGGQKWGKRKRSTRILIAGLQSLHNLTQALKT